MAFVTATMARIYLMQGQLERAEETFRTLLATRPDDEELRRGLTEVYLRRAARLRETPSAVVVDETPNKDDAQTTADIRAVRGMDWRHGSRSKLDQQAPQRAMREPARSPRRASPQQVGIASLLRCRNDSDTE